jgi:hypothetical protein
VARFDTVALAQRGRSTGLICHRRAHVSIARTDAVLEGLTALGYKVTKGTRPAWARDGRFVVRSAIRPNYFVEVSTVDERMQVRPVAFDAGGCLVVEKALVTAATPLKRLSVDFNTTADVSPAPFFRERTKR